MVSCGFKPETIITDKGREFLNKDFQEYCSKLKVEHITVGVESHASNGRVERIVRTIKDYLSKKVTVN
jgi:transposase InsO family protein